MVTRNWGIELWDRLNDVLSFSYEGVYKLDQLYQLCDGYRKINADHAKNIRKLLKAHAVDPVTLSSGALASSEVASVPSSLTLDTSGNGGNLSTPLSHLFAQSTYSQAQKLLLTSLEDEASQFAQLANNMETKVTLPMAKEVDRLKRQWKSHYEEIVQKRQELRQQQHHFKEVTRRYCHAYKDWLKAVEQLSKAENNHSLSNHDVEKHRRTKDTRREMFHRCQGDYASALQVFNRQQWDFYVNYLSDWSVSQVAMYESRYHLVKARLQDLGQLMRNNHVVTAEKQAHNLEQAHLVLDAAGDAERFVEALRTERLIPCDVAFLNLEESSSNSLQPGQQKGGKCNSASLSNVMQPGISDSQPSLNSEAAERHSMLDASIPTEEEEKKRDARQMKTKGSKARRSSLGRLGHGMRKHLGRKGASLSFGTNSATTATTESPQKAPSCQDKCTDNGEGEVQLGHRNSLGSSHSGSSASSQTAVTVDSPNTSSNSVRAKMASASLSLRESGAKLALRMRTMKAAPSTSTAPELKDMFASPSLALSSDARQRYIENIIKEMELTEKLIAGAKKNQMTYTEGSQPYLHAELNVRVYESKLHSLQELKKKHEEMAAQCRLNNVRGSDAVISPPKRDKTSTAVKEKSLSESSDSSHSFSSSDEEEDIGQLKAVSGVVEEEEVKENGEEVPDEEKEEDSDSLCSPPESIISTSDNMTDNKKDVENEVAALSIEETDATLTNKDKEKDRFPSSNSVSQLGYSICVALADYTPDESIPHGLQIRTKEEFVVLQADTGSGWTFVMRQGDPTISGIVPTSYIYLLPTTTQHDLNNLPPPTSTFITTPQENI